MITLGIILDQFRKPLSTQILNLKSHVCFLIKDLSLLPFVILSVTYLWQRNNKNAQAVFDQLCNHTFDKQAKQRRFNGEINLRHPFRIHLFRYKGKAGLQCIVLSLTIITQCIIQIKYNMLDVYSPLRSEGMTSLLV